MAMTDHQELRCAMERFWDEVARIMRECILKLGLRTASIITPATPVMHRLTQQYTDETAEEYKTFELVVQAKEEEQARDTQDARISPLDSPAQGTWGTEGGTEEGNNAQVKRRQKVKTRRAEFEALVMQKVEKQLAAVAVQASSLKIVVTSDSKHLFDRMFSAYGAAPGNVVWEAFVAALVDAGCSAKPNGGSGVTFKDKENSKASVVFDRPHPDPTIVSITLKSMGKRLHKWFNWEAETFVERQEEI